MKIAAGIAGAVLVVLTATAWAGGVFDAPAAGVVDEGEWGEVSRERTEIVTTVWVDNPNPALDAAGATTSVDYQLAMNGVTVADGEDTVPIRQGNQTREISVEVDNDRLQAWWVQYVRDDETIDAEFRATATGGIGPVTDTVEIERTRTHQTNETPIIEGVNEAVEGLTGTYTDGEAAGDPVIEVRSATAEWGEVSEERTTILLRATVHNPGDEPLSAAGFDRLEASVRANGVALVDVDATATDLAGVDPDDEIAPGETREVALAVPLDSATVDDWFRTHVESGERTELEVQVRATVESEDGGTVVVPDGGVVYTCEMQTAILVEGTAETSCGAA